MTASSLVDYKCDLVTDNCLAGVAILLEPHIQVALSSLWYFMIYHFKQSTSVSQGQNIVHVLKKMALYHTFLRKTHVVFGTSKNTRCSCNWPVVSPLSYWALHLMSALKVLELATITFGAEVGSINALSWTLAAWEVLFIKAMVSKGDGHSF